jgi:hypothetical protein
VRRVLHATRGRGSEEAGPRVTGTMRVS